MRDLEGFLNEWHSQKLMPLGMRYAWAGRQVIFALAQAGTIVFWPGP